MNMVEAYSCSPFYSQLEEPLSINDWEFLADFPDAAAFAKASLEIDGLLKPLQKEQEDCGRQLTEACVKLSAFEKAIAEVKKHVLDASAKEVLHDLIKAAEKDLEDDVTRKSIRLEQIRAKLAVFYEVTGKIRRAANPNVCGECPVCLHARVTLALIPCGHCICDACYRDRPICHYCCTPVDRSVKIYL
jgi:hypothetical protein